MKINNPFKYFRNKITEERRKDAIRETERIVNTDVYVANDKNDPENKIYIYVCGVPVAVVCDVIQDGEKLRADRPGG